MTMSFSQTSPLTWCPFVMFHAGPLDVFVYTPVDRSPTRLYSRESLPVCIYRFQVIIWRFLSRSSIFRTVFLWGTSGSCRQNGTGKNIHELFGTSIRVWCTKYDPCARHESVKCVSMSTSRGSPKSHRYGAVWNLIGYVCQLCVRRKCVFADDSRPCLFLPLSPHSSATRLDDGLGRYPPYHC